MIIHHRKKKKIYDGLKKKLTKLKKIGILYNFFIRFICHILFIIPDIYVHI